MINKLSATHLQLSRYYNFSTPLLLVGGGRLYHSQLLLTLAGKNLPLVAADGGLLTCKDLGLTPQMVIGDGDSLPSKACNPEETDLIVYKEQDSTDFEKVLYTIRAPLVIAFGFTGKRFDHTLASIHALGCYGKDQPIILIDDIDLIYTLSHPLDLQLPIGSRLSLFPLRASRFLFSDGLLYPLTGLTLSMETIIGCSNETTKDRVNIIPDADALSALILDLSCFDSLLHALPYREKVLSASPQQADS